MTEPAFDLHLDATVMENMTTYCDLHQTDANTLVNAAVADFLENHDPQLVQMIRGYLDMAALNKQISADFGLCESEAARLIR